MPTLSRILIYPVKSFDGVSVAASGVLPGGALRHDRQFALCDLRGRFINAKSNTSVHGLEMDVDFSKRTIGIRRRGQEPWHTFEIDVQRAALEAWLSGYFAQPVRLAENPATGFPDDIEAPGPTVISTATLETLAGWFDRLTLDDVRRRFRANLEIGGVEPFWEDRLYAAQGRPIQFRIGETLFNGTNPCQRCVVPTRSPLSGEADPLFAKTFADRRRETLPAWADRSRFDHFYRLSVNTCGVPSGTGEQIVRVGDDVQIVREEPA